MLFLGILLIGKLLTTPLVLDEDDHTENNDYSQNENITTKGDKHDKEIEKNNYTLNTDDIPKENKPDEDIKKKYKIRLKCVV